MKYYDLKEEMISVNRWHLGEVMLSDGEELWFNRCKPYVRDEVPKTYVHHTGYILAFCYTTFGVPVATRELGEAMKRLAGDDLQLVPLLVNDQPGMVVLNVLRELACVDESRSVFDKFLENDPVRPDRAGDYNVFIKLVLDPKKIPADADIFRITRDYLHVIVSERMKQVMEKAGCKGAVFRDVTPDPE